LGGKKDIFFAPVFSVKAAQYGAVTYIIEITLPAFRKEILNKCQKVQCKIA